MNNGWIKLNRRMLDWEWLSDGTTTQFFIYCLLRANHAPAKWRGVQISRGEFATSLGHISNDLGLSVQQVRTCIKKLKSTGEITSRTTNKSTLISITNWEYYQDSNKQNNTEITSKQHRDNTEITTNKNDNKYKNEKKEDLFCTFWENYPRKTNKKKARTSFLNLTEEKMLLAIEDCLSRYANTEKRFIPHATTYLNGERFYDEVISHEETGNRSKSDTAAAVGSLFEKEAHAAARRLSEGLDSEIQSYIPAKVGRTIQNH